MYAEGIRPEKSGWKGVFALWITRFRSSPQFKHSIFLYFYTAMILYQTLLGRSIWLHPLEAVFRGWGFASGWIVNEQILENVLIFTPFITLLFWTYGEKIIKEETVWSYLLPALKITACFSLSIEILQAVLHLGTLQISDFCYNVAGGVLGGLIYWCGYRIKHRKIIKKVTDA